MGFSLSKIIGHKMWLYYSAVLSIFMFIGGWRSARLPEEFVVNILVLPIFLSIWNAVWQLRKNNKTARNTW